MIYREAADERQTHLSVHNHLWDMILCKNLPLLISLSMSPDSILSRCLNFEPA